MEDRQKLADVLTNLLALLRASRWNYLTAHWQVYGDPYYGDHLLFQRLYESLDEEIDTLAEKIVGLTGRKEDGSFYFDNLSQIQKTQDWLTSWSYLSCPHKRSLRTEEDIQKYFKTSYEALKGEDLLTLGLDDYLMATANQHETNLYLLQQRLAERESTRLASQKLEKIWFGLRLSKGVDRREQDPDYEDYVKRKRRKNEKPMSLDKWQEWQEGNKPDADSPEAIRKEIQVPNSDQSFSDKDRQLLEKVKKDLSKNVQEAMKDLKEKEQLQLGRFMTDKEVQKKVEKELEQLQDQANREKVREEFAEELRAKGVDLPEGSLSDEESMKAMKKIFSDKDTQKQFAEAMVKALPKPLKEQAPPNFFLWAVQTVVDDMLSFTSKSDNYQSAEQRMQKYEDYKANFDKSNDRLKNIRGDLKSLFSKVPEDEDKKKEWVSKVDRLTSQYLDSHTNLQESLLEYKISDESTRKKMKSEVEKRRNEIQDLVEDTKKNLDKVDELKEKAKKILEDKKVKESEFNKALEKSKSHREKVTLTQEKLKSLKKQLKGEKKGTDKYKSLQKKIEQAKKDLESAKSEISRLFKPFTKLGAEENNVEDTTEAENDVADWFLNEMVDRLTDLNDEDVVEIVQNMSAVQEDVKESKKKSRLEVVWNKLSNITAEGYFFDNPEKRELRQMTQSKTEGNLTRRKQHGSPPTAVEIKEDKGGDEFSTLNRYVVDTEEKSTGLAKHRPLHPRLSSVWTYSKREEDGS